MLSSTFLSWEALLTNFAHVWFPPSSRQHCCVTHFFLSRTLPTKPTLIDTASPHTTFSTQSFHSLTLSLCPPGAARRPALGITTLLKPRNRAGFLASSCTNVTLLPPLDSHDPFTGVQNVWWRKAVSFVISPLVTELSSDVFERWRPDAYNNDSSHQTPLFASFQCVQLSVCGVASKRAIWRSTCHCRRTEPCS